MSSPLPVEVHELIEWEIAVAYAHGYRCALRDVAEGHAQLDASWRPVARRSYERRVAERIAEMERCARQLRAELARRARRRTATPAVGWPRVAVPGQAAPGQPDGPASRLAA